MSWAYDPQLSRKKIAAELGGDGDLEYALGQTPLVYLCGPLDKSWSERFSKVFGSTALFLHPQRHGVTGESDACKALDLLWEDIRACDIFFAQLPASPTPAQNIRVSMELGYVCGLREECLDGGPHVILVDGVTGNRWEGVADEVAEGIYEGLGMLRRAIERFREEGLE